MEQRLVWRSELYLGALRWKRNPRREKTLYLGLAKREREKKGSAASLSYLRRSKATITAIVLFIKEEGNLPLFSLVGSDS